MGGAYPDNHFMSDNHFRSHSRRDFLRSATRFGAAVVIGSAAPNLFLNRTRAASGQNPSEFIRVGFIGVGNQGAATSNG